MTPSSAVMFTVAAPRSCADTVDSSYDRVTRY